MMVISNLGKPKNYDLCWWIVLVAESMQCMRYFVFDEGMDEVAGAVADDQPDKSGL